MPDSQIKNSQNSNWTWRKNKGSKKCTKVSPALSILQRHVKIGLAQANSRHYLALYWNRLPSGKGKWERVLILGATPFQAQQHQPWTKQHHQNQGKLHSIETIRILFSHCDSWFTPFYNLCGVLKGILHSIAMHSNIKTLCNLEATALWWQEHPKCLKCQHATQCEALDWNTVTTPLDNNT